MKWITGREPTLDEVRKIATSSYSVNSERLYSVKLLVYRYGNIYITSYKVHEQHYPKDKYYGYWKEYTELPPPEAWMFLPDPPNLKEKDNV